MVHNVMFRRVNFYSICFAFGLSVLLILAGSRYADNTYYRPSMESRGNVRTFLKVEDGEETYMPQVLSADPYESVSDIEKMFEVVRTQIKAVTSKYNFTYSGVRNLEDLLMESGGKPLKSIIISTWRSGTTFLGEVLNAIPGTFYHYEPLLKFGIVQIRGPPESNDALSTIKNMLKCDFYGMDSYFKYGKTHMHQFSHNSRLWDHCKYNRELCYDADFTSRFCRLFPFQTMKVVRLRLRLLQDILDDVELNVKVLLLIRDPRGVMQSRQHRSFCPPSADCWHPELLCADMINDYVAASRLLTQHPDKLMVLRYEDLALNPNVTTHRILEFLRLSATTSVDEYLRKHTKNEVGGVSSTYRVTSSVPFKWKNELEFAYVDEVQNACKEAMDLWGYRMAHNATHMASKEFIPITNYTVIQ